MRRLLFSLALAACLNTFGHSAVAQPAMVQELKVLRATPEGEDVPAEKQIVITFNRPVVPLGRMERKKEEIPVTITPEVECQWRWINTTSLACNLDDKKGLIRSTKYHLTLNPGLKAEDGATLAEAYQHDFITERADVRYSWFREWTSPSMPVVRLTFNQSVTKESVQKSMYMATPEGNLRQNLVVDVDPEDHEQPDFLPVPGEGKLFALFRKQDKKKSDDDKRVVGGVEARRIWIIHPEKELALDTHYVLKLEAGLVSAFGPEKSVAKRDIVEFDTFPEFSIVGVKCRTNEGDEIIFKQGETQTKLCNPMDVISLSFSSPILRSQIAKNFNFVPTLGKKGANLEEVWGDLSDEYSRRHNGFTKGQTFDVSLPYGLKAAQSYTANLTEAHKGFFGGAWLWVKSLFTDVPSSDIEDEFGRKLTKPFSVAFATSHRKPNFEMEYHDAVLEKQTDSDVPLYVNNLDSFSYRYRSVAPTGVKEDQQKEHKLPKVEDTQYAVPFGVRDALGGKSGAVFGSLVTSPYVEKGSDAYRLFAEVTPWHMHVKLGHFSSLIWLTDMANGNAVKDAKVTIYKDSFSAMSRPKDILATGTTDENGLVTMDGLSKLDPNLDLMQKWHDDDTRLFIRADKGEDMALMPISSSFMIDTWRASNESISQSNQKEYGHINAWGTTAQGIYRAGDTVQYKFYVRNQNDRTLIPAPQEGYKLQIIDPMGNVAETVDDLKLNAFGAYSGEFKVASSAPVGWYRFKLTGKFTGKAEESNNADSGDEGEQDSNDSDKRVWYPIRVLVSDFTPVPFKVTSQVNGDLFHSQQAVEVQTAAQLHSGGAYTQAQARVTAILEGRSFDSKNPALQGFYFSTANQMSGSQQVFQKIEPLNNKGELTTKFDLPKMDNLVYGRLMVESAVQDDRGRYVAAQSHADYVGLDRFVGVKSPQWVYESKKPATVEYIVADDHGNPVKGTKVDVIVERQVTTAAKVKGAGNAYLTEFTTAWKQESTCQGVSEEKGTACTFTPAEAGSYRVTAKISDTKGRAHSSEIGMWVTGRDYVMWENGSDVLLPIVPEKAEYHVGDTARYLIKNPWPGSKALVTVERYGIIERFVKTLDGSTPIIEIPVKPDYLPGFYLSVMVVSPRVDKPLENGQVDLGKPSFRMGYVTVPVKDAYKEMLVTAKADKDVYRPRDTVHINLHAEPRKKDKSEPIEYAVAVLDESVFDLVQGGTDNFDPYKGFYSLGGLDLRNYNLLLRMIGRQKFEKKGANPGGDGGADLSIRDLFKFVAYWNPSLKADEQGNATADVSLPDNLTGWRVLALAVTPSDRLGLGQGNFKVNKPTEVRPVMPNQVTEKDSFKAGFSVMNRTDKPRTLKVTLKAEGTVNGETPIKHEETITLEPYKRATVFMPVAVGAVNETRDAKGEIRFTATAGDAQDKDGMVHTVPVHKMRSLETAANYGTTTEGKVTESVLFPENIFPDVGSVSVVLAPSVIGAVEGAFRYMKDYPYLCWEQILSKSVMAAHYQNLKQYMPESFTWKGSETLSQASLDLAKNFQAPNGGMTYFVAKDEYVDPYLSAYTALSFNWLRHAGYKIPEVVENKLHDYLLNYLRNNTAPTFYSEGMNSTIRAVALAALSEHGKITAEDIDRFKPHVPQMSLFGKTHFAEATLRVEGKKAVAKEVIGLILSHSNQTGGKFVFNEELDDSYSRLLSSPLRENCAILDLMTHYAADKEGKEVVADIPFKLVRTITATRKGRDHWENTQENMFCMNALVDYSKVYESVKPSMTVKASMDGKGFGEASFHDLRDKSATLERPIVAGDAGRKTSVEIERQGEGRLYYATRVQYAPKSDFSQTVNAGMEMHREYSVERGEKWEILNKDSVLKRGELVRVDLYLSLPTARNFVVVDDPIPGGLEPVNRELANTSKVDADKGEFVAAGGSWFFKFHDWIGYNVSRWSFYHQELRHDAARFFADYLPAGNYHLSYTASVVAEGKFTAMPTLAQEMYDPDIYGKGVMGEMRIGE